MDLLALEPGILLLAYNDDSESSRSTLVLAMSTDDGSSWDDVAILEADPAGSFHYPTLMYQEEQVCPVVSHRSSSHAMCQPPWHHSQTGVQYSALVQLLDKLDEGSTSFVLQDTVLVIYSVDFLPDEPSSRATRRQGDNSTEGGLQWSCAHCCASHEAPLGAGASSLPFQTSQCKQPNAWGKESWGMRLAILQAAAIRAIAEGLKDQQSAAS